MSDSLTPSLLTSLLLAAMLLLSLLVKFWLASRQIRHVARHREQVPAAFAGLVGLDAHRKAADYTRAKARLGLLELALGGAVLLGWTLLGGLDLLNHALLALLGPDRGLMQPVALVACFAVINGLIDLPMGAYQTFVLEQRFGFNRMTVRLWLADLLRGSALGALIGLPLVTLVLWLMGAAGAWWWLWTWAVWMGFNLLILFIYPTFIAPLFNRFQPLDDDHLRQRVTALMARCGFRASGLFVMDGSRRSAHANAYFTGFGAARRVVFFDTLLQKLTPEEVEAVLAHELGHFKHRHIAQRIVLMFGVSLAGLALLGWLSTRAWFYTGLGVTPNMNGTPNDALALLLFLLVAPVFTFVLGPVFAALSRRNEFEADAYAASQSSGQALSSALLKLYEDNAATLTPDPLYVKVYYSHPPASERLARLAQPPAAGAAA
jgi:STE24 endopeptidase